MTSWSKRSSRKNSLSRNKISRFLWCRYAYKLKELLAHQKNLEEMCNYIKAKSLKFLSLDGLYGALEKAKETKRIHNLVTIILQESIQLNHQIILEMLKIRQLSLLSGKSNN